jgi:hypothetical protein
MTSSKTRSVYSAICRSNGVFLVRARATVGSRFPQNASRASAYSHPLPAILPFGNVIASILPVWRRLAGSFEALRTPLALSSRPFFSTPYRGHLRRLISAILAGAKSTTGKCFSLLRALVQDANQTASRIFHGFVLTPIGCLSHPTHSAHQLGLVAVPNGHRSSERKIGNVRKSSGEIRNVIR